MRKKIVYIGLAVIIVSVVAIFAVGYSAEGSIVNTIQHIFSNSSAIVPANGVHSFVIRSPGITGNATFIFEVLTDNEPVNTYLFNGSGYASWNTTEGRNGTTGLSAAQTLEGRGAMLIYENVTMLYIYADSNNTGASVNVSPNITKTVYKAPLINVSPAGDYYVVLDNGVPSASHTNSVEAKAEYLDPTSQSALRNSQYLVAAQNSINTLGELGAVFWVALFAGIIVTLYGVFSRPKEPEGQQTKGQHQKTQEEKYIDALYKNVGKRGRKKERKAKAS